MTKTVQKNTSLLGAVLLCLVQVGCSDTIGHCEVDADCPGGVCVEGTCVSAGDRDRDGVPDASDNCPGVYNPDQSDRDVDGLGDACDPCPDSLANDPDADGICDDRDNCPGVANPDQSDLDGDGKGDACDLCPTGAEDDGDGDGVCDDGDNCPGIANQDQADGDGDNVGDACDPCPTDSPDDPDNDGVCSSVDNCPQASNAGQADGDGDGVGDACDPCPIDAPDDVDDDGVCSSSDNCPQVANVGQADQDADGEGDVCDPCPNDPDDDEDADGHCGDLDNCPQDYNPDQADDDGDGAGNPCDAQDDDFREGGPVDPDCQHIPPRGAFEPEEEIGWSSSAQFPDQDQVMSTPTVINLTDDNGDGVVDERDVPDVVFNSFDTYVCGSYICLGAGVLRAVSGDSFTELWAAQPSGNATAPAASVAAADIDGDGLTELVTLRFNGGIIAFEHDGVLKWSCSDFGADNCDDYASLHGGNQWGGPAIADLDGDGVPEIIHGASVYRNNGQLWWEGAAGLGDNGVGPISAVANLDRVGFPEVITGSTAYRYDGQIYWSNGMLDGFVAIGNFDGDDNPEIVVVSYDTTDPTNLHGTIRLQNHDGSLVWGPFALPGEGRGGPPTVADFDNDGSPEIGVADHDTYVMFDTDGSIVWQQPTQDHSSSATGSSVFDFEADGWAEVVYNDEVNLRIYDGETGQVLFERANSSFTAHEYPVIADVDNDGNAEIVVCANNFILTPADPGYPGQNGIRIFGDLEDNWVRTRRIWNQHTYHITNILEGGRVPTAEPESWLEFNSYRQNELPAGEGTARDAPDLAAADPEVITTGCPTRLIIRVWVENRGAIDAPSGIPVSFYDGDPSAGGVFLGVVYTSRMLQPGQAQRVHFIWNNPPVGSPHDVYVVVDDFGSGTGWTSECGDEIGAASNNQIQLSAVGCP